MHLVYMSPSSGNNQQELVNTNTMLSVMLSPTESSKSGSCKLGGWVYFLISFFILLAISNIILVAIILYMW